MTRLLLRSAAVLIAILGAIDPALTSERMPPVTISLIDSTSSASPGAADQIAAAIATTHIVARGPNADAAVTVVAGDRLPANAGQITGPVMVVLPAPAASVAIARVTSPSRASFESRVPVRVELRPLGERAARVAVALQVSGVVVDRVEKDVAAGAPAVFDLTFVPVSRGVAAARVSAAIVGSTPQAFADLAVDVADRTWSVLVFDRRASWMSTFVRRAIEADARFKVTSRTSTSTNVSAASTDAPASLGANAQLDRFDAIVVGAPDALTGEDASSLEQFARRHGGAVIALMDRSDAGPIGALAGVARWSDVQTNAPVDVAANVTAATKMRASEFAVPAVVPAAADVLATIAGAAGASRAAALQTPLGAGRLIISGLLDGWRYRGAPESSAFDAFWRETIGGAADATPRPIDIAISSPVAAPGDETTIEVTLRDVALTSIAQGGVATRVSAELRSERGGGTAAVPVRLWPAGLGRFTATLSAPARAGTYRVAVSDGTHTAVAPLVVLADAQRPAPNDRELLQAWASSRGGTTIESPDPDAVLNAIAQLAQPARRAERWHPMRSAWWIVPFGLLLGGEWWLRRRRDLV